MTSARVVVWDRDGKPPYDDAILWRSYGEHGSQSIPRLVDLDEERLRERILAALHDVATTPVGDSTLVDHLEVRPGLSYWWMSLPAAKRWGGTGVVADAVKLLALIDHLDGRDISEVVIESDRECISNGIKAALEGRGVHVRVPSPPPTRRRRAPALVKAIRHLLMRIQLRSATLSSSASDDGVTLIGPYFRVLEEDGHLQTAYFGGLPRLLRSAGLPITWLHLSAGHDTAERRGGIQRSLRGRTDRHTLVDSVPIARCLAVLSEYRRLRQRLRSVDPTLRLTGDAAIVWPLFRDEWADSIAGSHLMASVILLQGFERILGAQSHQKCGIYVMENQPWEFAFQSAWRSSGHGRLIGMNHSSYRYWDLRYRIDPRDASRPRCAWMSPDRVASNGRFQDAALADNSILGPLVDEVEALMYLNLSSIPHGPRDRTIVLGELNRRSTTRLVNGVLEVFAGCDEVPILKPHPLNPVPDEWKGFVETTEQPLTLLLPHSRRVVMAASGTAMLEAISVGVPVIAVMDGEELDLRPCRDDSLVLTVRNMSELRAAFTLPDADMIVTDCFRLDPELPGWRRLLGLP